jgi:hypothetical protein|nr:MAG TPA: portal [Caudoviricetes sp.]
MSLVSNVGAEMTNLHLKTRIIDDLLGGTLSMRAAGQKYLFKMPLENKDAYENRLNRSTLYPALSETLAQMCGRVFYSPINVSNVDKKIVEDILPDVDTEGNALDVFASQWFYAALAYGVSFVLVDYTKTGDAKTKAEEKAIGARPYLVHIKPQNVLGIKYDRINGNKVMTQFRYKEFVTEEDGEFATKVVEQINVYEIGRVRKYKPQSDGNGKSSFIEIENIEVKANGAPLTFIPIVPFITKKTGHFALGEPPLMELANLNIKHWQSQSDQDNLLNTARVPLLVRIGVTDDSTVKIGNSIVDLPAGADLRYVEHTGSAIAAGQKSLNELETQMRVAGAKLLEKADMAMTESQARDEQNKEISALRLYANRFEDALDLVLEYVGVWLGIESKEVGNVEISGNIDGNLDPNASMDSVIKLQSAGIISKQTTFEEAKRRGLISDNVNWEDEQARTDGEGLNNDDFSE